MSAQDLILGARVAHVRELKAELAQEKAANAALRDENAALKAHFDFALLAAQDLRDLPADVTTVESSTQASGATLPLTLPKKGDKAFYRIGVSILKK